MSLSPLIIEIVGSAAIVGGTGVFFWLLGRVIRAVARRAGTQPATVRGIGDALSLMWIAVAAYGVVAFTGLASVFTILTISGIAGLAVSLALQTTLSNMVSGILLLHDRVIRVGDDISCGGVRGTIVRIAMRNTWLRTKDGDIAVIGNANLHSGPLVNHSAAHRFDEQLRVEEWQRQAGRKHIEMIQRKVAMAGRVSKEELSEAQVDTNDAGKDEPARLT